MFYWVGVRSRASQQSIQETAQTTNLDQFGLPSPFPDTLVLNFDLVQMRQVNCDATTDRTAVKVAMTSRSNGNVPIARSTDSG
jgi:hypothetical protein